MGRRCVTSKDGEEDVRGKNSYMKEWIMLVLRFLLVRM